MNKENWGVKSTIVGKNKSFMSQANNHSQAQNLSKTLTRSSLNLHKSLKKDNKKKKKVTFGILNDMNKDTKNRMKSIRKSVNLGRKTDSRISLKDILYNENNIIQINLSSNPKGRNMSLVFFLFYKGFSKVFS